MNSQTRDERKPFSTGRRLTGKKCGVQGVYFVSLDVVRVLVRVSAHVVL